MSTPIKFTSNPNGKLFLDRFSDVRLYDASKHFVGNDFDVHLKNQSLGYIKVEALRVFSFNKITDLVSYLVAGKPAPYLAKMLRQYYHHEGAMTNDTQLVHLCFVYTQRNIELHEKLMKEWWYDKVQEQNQIS